MIGQSERIEILQFVLFLVLNLELDPSDTILCGGKKLFSMLERKTVQS